MVLGSLWLHAFSGIPFSRAASLMACPIACGLCPPVCKRPWHLRCHANCRSTVTLRSPLSPPHLQTASSRDASVMQKHFSVGIPVVGLQERCSLVQDSFRKTNWTLKEHVLWGTFVGHAHHDVIACCANRRHPGGAMSHDDSFDRFGRRPRVLRGVENVPCMRTFQNRSETGGLRNPQTSAQLFGIDPCLHNGGRPGGVGNAVWKGFDNSTDVIPVAASPCCSNEITCNHVNLLTNHDGTDGEDDLLDNTSYFGVDIV